jgi:hypothetical protein
VKHGQTLSYLRHIPQPGCYSHQSSSSLQSQLPFETPHSVPAAAVTGCCCHLPGVTHSFVSSCLFRSHHPKPTLSHLRTPSSVKQQATSSTHIQIPLPQTTVPNAVNRYRPRHRHHHTHQQQQPHPDNRRHVHRAVLLHLRPPQRLSRLEARRYTQAQVGHGRDGNPRPWPRQPSSSASFRHVRTHSPLVSRYNHN